MLLKPNDAVLTALLIIGNLAANPRSGRASTPEQVVELLHRADADGLFDQGATAAQMVAQFKEEYL